MNYSKLYRSLFRRNEPLSRKDVDAYISKNRDIHKIEEKALEDDFNMDALDGFQAFNSTTKEMSRLDSYFQNKWSFSNYNFVLIVFGCLLIGGIGLVFLIDMNRNKEVLAEARKQPLETNSDEDANVSQRKEVLELEEGKFNDQPIIAPHSIVLKKERDLRENERPEKGNNLQSESIDPLIFSLPPKIVESLTVKVDQQLRVSKAEELYILDFKVIDYSAYRNAFEMEDVKSGVPAKFSNEEKSNVTLTEETKSIGYDNYLTVTLELLQQEQWEDALSRFRVILKNYPKDLNASFYAGLSCFNLGKYEQAKLYFENAYAADMYNFYEEAKWFESLCLAYSKKMNEARRIWKSIVAYNGFYASSAQQKLDESN